MTRPDPRHIRLIEAATFLREMRLSQVSAARMALSASLAHRDALDPNATDSDDPAVQMADLRHRLWAEGRRRALAPVIAVQEATLQEQRYEAARAVARCQVLGQIFRQRRDQPS